LGLGQGCVWASLRVAFGLGSGLCLGFAPGCAWASLQAACGPRSRLRSRSVLGLHLSVAPGWSWVRWPASGQAHNRSRVRPPAVAVAGAVHAVAGLWRPPTAQSRERRPAGRLRARESGFGFAEPNCTPSRRGGGLVSVRYGRGDGGVHGRELAWSASSAPLPRHPPTQTVHRPPGIGRTSPGTGQTSSRRRSPNACPMTVSRQIS